MFDRADIGRTLVVKRNPDYWGKDLPINRGRFNFDRIRYEMFGDFDSAFESFKAGEYTYRNETSSMHWATRYDFPALASGAVVRETLPDGQIASGDLGDEMGHQGERDDGENGTGAGPGAAGGG